MFKIVKRRMTLMLLAGVLIISGYLTAISNTMIVHAGTSDSENEIIVQVRSDGYSESGNGWGDSSISSSDGTTKTRYNSTLGGSAIWKTTVSAAGTYEVYVWRVNNTYSTGLQLEYTNGKVQAVDWSENKEEGWVKLGETEYQENAPVQVVMSNPQGGMMRAAAVKFVLKTSDAGEPEPEEPSLEEKLTVDTSDGNSHYRELTGTWKDSAVQGYDGTGSRYSLSEAASVEWKPVVTTKDEYTVRLYHPVHSTDVENEVKIEILDAEGRSLKEETVIWSGTDTAGWISLGSYELQQGQMTIRVTKTDRLENPENPGAHDQALRADAVQLVKTSELEEPEEEPTTPGIPDAGQDVELIVDYGEDGYEETGTWKESGKTGCNGTKSRYSDIEGSAASWSAKVQDAGTYQIYIYRIADAVSGNQTVDVSVTNEATGSELLKETQNWKSSINGWSLLGEYTFEKDDICKVQVINSCEYRNTYTRVDAVKFVYTKTYVEMPYGTYYVDATNGDDTNCGTSPETAWKTLDKVNSCEFAPGSSILLKKGETWNGKLSPKGNGTADAVNFLGNYGEGEKLPVINGNGCENGAVEFFNQEYWEINGLEVTNAAEGETLGNADTYDKNKNTQTRHGIYVVLENFDAEGDNTAEHIYVKNCVVHHVIGTLAHPHKGVGIFFYVDNSADKSRFNDILIEGNQVYDVDRSGIIIRSQDTTDPDSTYNTNVVIQKNYLKNIGGDGIVAKVSSAPLIQYNVCENACARATGGNVNNAAVWVWQCKDAVIQYNEVYGTGLKGGNADGQAFDSDYNCEGTIIQYNYSHHNDGGFVLLIAPSANDFNKGTTVRYNISENDKKDIFEISGSVEDAKIYNNTVYQSLDETTTLLRVNTYFAVPKDEIEFINNIFYSTKEGIVIKETDNGRPLRGNIRFETNLFCGYKVPESVNREVNDPTFPGHWTLTAENCLNKDPKLAAPGTGVTGIDFTDTNRLSGYRTTEDSPCVNAGIAIDANGGKDFWGNSLYIENPDIGAFETKAETTGNSSENNGNHTGSEGGNQTDDNQQENNFGNTQPETEEQTSNKPSEKNDKKIESEAEKQTDEQVQEDVYDNVQKNTPGTGDNMEYAAFNAALLGGSALVGIVALRIMRRRKR